MSEVLESAYNHLFEVIGRHVELSYEDQQACRAEFQPCLALPKQTPLEKQERIPQHLYFVHTGVLRLYQIHSTGDAVTTFLTGPSSFATPYLDFIHQQPAQATLETVSPATLLRIRHSAMRQLIDQNPRFQTFSLLIFEQALAQVQGHAQRLAALSADAHYRRLLEIAHPWLALVPVQDIASYLGIHAQSLSRIRRQLQGD